MNPPYHIVARTPSIYGQCLGINTWSRCLINRRVECSVSICFHQATKRLSKGLIEGLNAIMCCKTTCRSCEQIVGVLILFMHSTRLNYPSFFFSLSCKNRFSIPIIFMHTTFFKLLSSYSCENIYPSYGSFLISAKICKYSYHIRVPIPHQVILRTSMQNYVL